jgi:hypothetical protein
MDALGFVSLIRNPPSQRNVQFLSKDSSEAQTGISFLVQEEVSSPYCSD